MNSAHYHTVAFNTSYELTDFLNEKGIPPANVITITYVDRFAPYPWVLVYVECGEEENA